MSESTIWGIVMYILGWVVGFGVGYEHGRDNR